jgi:hypothetical protein
MNETVATVTAASESSGFRVVSWSTDRRTPLVPDGDPR